ncbi:MAG: ABC transporter permease, partial [Betaproteobacteria bacterium]
MTNTARTVVRSVTRHWPAFAIFAGLIVLWQLAVTFLGMREYLLPSPMSVMRAMFGDEIPWGKHIWVTAVEIVGAFVLAGVCGVILGVAIAWSSTWARALTPFLVFVNTLPKVAIAPLFLMWMGYGIVPNML